MQQPQEELVPTVDGAPREDAMPLAVVKNKKKNKKLKYSRGLKDLQKSSRSLTKISVRLARANARGMQTYLKASDKSARKKRDGAMRDFGVNVAKGLGKSLRLSSRVPVDMAKALTPRGARKRMRRQLKASARLARAFRIR
jgi:hypothetical protein